MVNDLVLVNGIKTNFVSDICARTLNNLMVQYVLKSLKYFFKYFVILVFKIFGYIRLVRTRVLKILKMYRG